MGFSSEGEEGLEAGLAATGPPPVRPLLLAPGLVPGTPAQQRPCTHRLKDRADQEGGAQQELPVDSPGHPV